MLKNPNPQTIAPTDGSLHYIANPETDSVHYVQVVQVLPNGHVQVKLGPSSTKGWYVEPENLFDDSTSAATALRDDNLRHARSIMGVETPAQLAAELYRDLSRIDQTVRTAYQKKFAEIFGVDVDEILENY